MYNDFKQYANSNQGINGGVMNDYVQANMTPYILEERKMNVTQMDVFSRLLKDRIIYVQGEVNDTMSSIVSAQLMYLDSVGNDDITLYVDSGGGSCKSGLTITDTMNYIDSDVSTVNMGMAASMGSIILGAGTKGKRHILPNARVMLHTVSSGAQGVLADMKISLREAERYNETLFKMLGEFCGKSPEEILKDADRDLWLWGQEAIDYGIVDEMITSKK
jgi:ATP-dependent Clp protease protease subunit